VLHAHRLALRGIAVGSLAAACVFAFVLASCASPAARGPQDAIAPAKPLQAAKPRFAEGGPDAEDYGASNGYPIGDRSTFFRIPFLVGSQSHFDQIFEGRLIRRSTTPSSLARAASEPAVRYEYQGQSFTLDDYLARNPATGLLVARGEAILIERYQYGRNDRHRITSWSMAKTVTSMLIGIAIADGHIRSVDDPAAPMCPCLPTPSTGALRSVICSRCPQACASSRSTREGTTFRGSPPTRFGRSVPAASKQ
jgi:CubicO group peptidase (beta-lactamase class C family)